MFTTNEVVEMVKKGYINGSVYQCKSLKEFIEMQVKLCNIGWKRVYENGVLTVYTLERGCRNYWYTLIFQQSQG